MTYAKLKTNIERELLMVLIMGLRYKKISSIRAKEVSRKMLETLKTSSTSIEALDSISKICERYPELVEPYIKVAKKYEEEDKQQKLNGISFYLQSGDVDIVLKQIKNLN